MNSSVSGRHVAAGVVGDQQHRSVLGHVAQVPHLAPEPEGGQEPGERQVLADVVGVAIVEVRGQAPPEAPRDAPRRSRRRRRGRRCTTPPPRPGDPVQALEACHAGIRFRCRRCASRARQASPRQPWAAILARQVRAPRAAVLCRPARATARRRMLRARARARGACEWRPDPTCSRISPFARSGSSTWGTWPHSLSTTWRACGSTSATCLENAAGTRRSRSPQMNRAGVLGAWPAGSTARRSPCGASR